jgi:hypothetical protein
VFDPVRSFHWRFVSTTMDQPGLTNRLRQHSRRAGLMVGFSMLLTIALCVGSFVFIYTKVDPLTHDFVDAAGVKPTATAKTVAAANPTKSSSSGGSTSQEQPTPKPTSTPQPTPKPTTASNAFKPDYEINPDSIQSINLRPGPAVASGDPIEKLAPGTQLQYLNQTKPSEDPNADGASSWMEFRTQDGNEGWVRSIDVQKINN